MALDKKTFNVANRGSGGPVMHNYVNTADAVATIEGSGYFNGVADQIRTNDMVSYIGSDGARIGRLAKSGSNVVTMTSKSASFS
jgi:hypothetical protein